MTPTVRVAALPELVSVVPHLLGFEPRSSLVVLGLEGARVVWAQRADLPQDRDVAHGLALRLLACADRELPDALVVLAYEESPGEGCLLLDRLEELGGDWWEVAEVGTVRDGTVLAPGCADAGCCPPEGMQVPAASPAAAELVLAGSAPARTRAARMAQLECDDRACAAAVERCLAARPSPPSDLRWVDAWRRLVTDVAPDGGPERASWLATLVLSAEHVPSRDALAWALLSRAGLDPGPLPPTAWETALALGPVSDLPVVVERLARAARGADGPRAAGLLALLGLLAWHCGDGVLAGGAAGRALRLDAEHRLAWLIQQVAAVGLRPEGAVS